MKIYAGNKDFLITKKATIQLTEFIEKGELNKFEV